jgi:hypothetical protein
MRIARELGRRIAPALFAAGLLVGSAGAQDPAFDDFERHALGPSWIVLAGPAAIVGDSDLGVIASGGCAVAWSGSSFGADQWSETTLSNDVDPNMLMQVYVRRRSGDLARYAFHWNGDPGRDRWEIKYDGVPTAQTRILASAAGSPPLPGDRLRIEARGTSPVVLRGFHNGELLLEADDGAPERIVVAGMTGVIARPKQGSTVTPPVAIFECWSGGTLTPEILCRRGNVAGALGGEPAAVLLVNGSAGHDVLRELRVPRSSPVSVTLAEPPRGSTSGRYALWAWTSVPSGTHELSAAGAPIGCVVLPTPLHRGQTPQPFRCLRGGLPAGACGSVVELAAAPPRVPWTLARSGGFARSMTLTLQGVIEDSGAAHPSGLSVTNAVVLILE